MGRTNFFLTAAGLLMLMLMIGAAPTNSTSAKGATSAAEDALKSKGLTRVGIIYELDDDAHLQAGLRAMYQAKSKLEDNSRKRQAIDNDITAAGQKIAQLNEQERQLSEKIAQTSRRQANYNEMVLSLISIQSNIRDGYKYIDDRKKARAQVVDPTDDFITATQDLAAKMEAASKEYAALASDPAVTGAIAQINESAVPKVKLGPSAAFAKALPAVLRERDAINSAVIQCDVSNGVAVVDVTFNDSVQEKAVVDSGASAVSIPAAIARKLDLKPSKSDPPVKLKIANGQTVTAHLMHLKSVRLGQFRVEDVECVVMPEGAGKADILLGGTFLKNFVYRMDLATGQLHMAEIAKSPKGAPAPPATSPAKRDETTSADGKSVDDGKAAGTPAASDKAPATKPVAKVVDLPASPQKLVCDGGKSALAAQDGTPERGKPLITRASDEGTDELWTIKSNSDGMVQFINKKAKMALSTGMRDAAGIKLYAWPVNRNDSQLWKLEPVSEDGKTFKVVSKNSGFCLTAHPKAHGAGGAVTQEQWQDSDDQKWQFSAGEQ